MFIGHYAVGFAAKKWAPKTSLALLFGAAIWLDIVWPIFVMLGLERFAVAPGITRMSPFDFLDYPLSHSLVMAVVWGAGLALVYLLIEKDAKSAWILGGLVVSHWFLDLIVHRPDLPLLPAEINNSGMLHKYGLGLWNYPAWELPVEFGLFAAGVWIYAKSTKESKPWGNLGLVGLVFFLAAFFIASLKVTVPNNTNGLVFFGQLLTVIFLFLGYWVDDNRKSV